MDGWMDGRTSCDSTSNVKPETHVPEITRPMEAAEVGKTKNIPDPPLRPWEDHGGRVSRSSEGLLRYLGFNLLCSSAFPGQVKPSTPGGQFFFQIHSRRGKDTE